MQLRDTARWTRILAVVGWVFIVLMGVIFLMFLLGGSVAGLLSGADVSTQILSGFLASAIILATYWYPTLMLHRFSRQMKSASDSGDADLIFSALKSLKRFFKFCAILILSFIGLYILVFVAGLIVAFN